MLIAVGSECFRFTRGWPIPYVGFKLITWLLDLQAVGIGRKNSAKVHGAQMGPGGPMWAPCWPHKTSCQGRFPMYFLNFTWMQYFWTWLPMLVCVLQENDRRSVLTQYYTDEFHMFFLIASLNKYMWMKLSHFIFQSVSYNFQHR